MPSIYIIAGPNGAGKTTFIRRFAPRHLAMLDFINADKTARTPRKEEDRIVRINKMNRILPNEADASVLRTSSSCGASICEPAKSCNPANPINPVSKFVRDEFPLAPGVPMYLLTERGLNEPFLDVVDQHRRAGLPVVVRREGQVTRLPADQLTAEITRARNRISELTAEIAKYERLRFSANETPDA
jgi:hypothetical protein